MLRESAAYLSRVRWHSSLYVMTVLATTLILTGCSTQSADHVDRRSTQAAEEFRRALHACQHMGRPQAGDEWHPSAASPEIEGCLARAGWQPDGTLTQSAQFERALHACQHARAKRRGRAVHPSSWTREVKRCLAAKGWMPDGTPTMENVN